jgi:hypothetical protein
MDLRTRLLRFAAARPHALVVAARGGTAVRLAVEQELARRGWPQAANPADADLLVVAGRPGGELAKVVETMWTSLPMPRARCQIDEAGDVAAALDRARAALATPGESLRPGSRQADATRHDTDHSAEADQGPHGSSHDGHDAHAHGGHGDMEMPGGLPMADLGEDRDGLMLDQLRVSLGPVLPAWPAGLVAEVTLQGDVIQEASLRLVDDPVDTPFWPRDANAGDSADPGHQAGEHRDDDDRHDRSAQRELRCVVARELDGLGRVLAVAGWPDPATRARRLRDDVLDDEPLDVVGVAAADLSRRIARSRTLGRMLRGLPDVPALVAMRLAALDGALATLMAATGHRRERHGAPRAVGSRKAERTRLGLAELEQALVGTELAAARLLVAAADPDTERPPTGRPAGAVPVPRHAHHEVAEGGAHDG